MFGLGMPELIVILLIALVIFGASKLPQIGEGLGKAIRGFRRSLSEPDSKSNTPSHPGKKRSEPQDK